MEYLWGNVKFVDKGNAYIHFLEPYNFGHNGSKRAVMGILASIEDLVTQRGVPVGNNLRQGELVGISEDRTNSIIEGLKKRI